MSSLYPHSDSPPPYFHKHLSSTSIALIFVFFFCFISIVYISAKTPRLTPRALASSTVTSKPLTARRRRRPRLSEFWLEKHLDGTVHDWLPLAAWHNDGPVRAHSRQESRAALVQAWVGRASTFITESRGAIQSLAPSPPALLPISNSRTLNVAVLVAMPRREDTWPFPRPSLDPWDRPGLFYDGQLELGVTSLLSTTPEEYEQSM